MSKSDMTAEQASNRLLALFMWLVSVFFGRRRVEPLPPPARPVARVERPGDQIAKQLGIPARYGDIAYRNGGNVPYAVIFAHIRQGGKVREDAYTMLKCRVPDAAEFIEYTRRHGSDSDITKTFVSGDEHTTLDRLLHAAVAWRDERAAVEAAKGLKYDYAAIVACEDRSYRPR